MSRSCLLALGGLVLAGCSNQHLQRSDAYDRINEELRAAAESRPNRQAINEALGRAVFTDRVFGAPARWIARKASAGAPAYLYHFSYVGDRFRRVLTRAHHAAEIQYVFEYWGRRTPMSVVSDEDRAMASLMHGCWTAFAKTGTPTCEGQAWPAYDAASDTLLEFGSPTGLRQNFRKQPFDALEQVTLPTLALPER